MLIKNHRLVDVPFKQAADTGKPLKPDTIVIHYTASSSGRGSIDWLTKRDDSFVSAHLVVDRDGSITQLVPFNVRAAHAGVSEWNGRESLNQYSIGIEFVNFGPLSMQPGRRFLAWTKAVVPADQVIDAKHKNAETHAAARGLSHWQTFTPEQIAAGAKICAALIDAYGIKEIVGHDDIAPNRKVDPGPAWPWESFREQVDALTQKASPKKAAEQPSGLTVEQLERANQDTVLVADQKKGTKDNA